MNNSFGIIKALCTLLVPIKAKITMLMVKLLNQFIRIQL